MEHPDAVLTELRTIRRICEELTVKVSALEAQRSETSKSKQRMIEKRLKIKYERQKKQFEKSESVINQAASYRGASYEPVPFISLEEWAAKRSK